MFHFSFPFAFILSFLFSCQLLFNGISAQSIWLDRTHNNSIFLEIHKPEFPGGNSINFSTTSWYLSGRFRTGKNLTIVPELPFARFSAENTDSENTFGNPYLGIEVHSANSGVYGEIGIRFPVAPDDEEENGAASVTGFLADFVDRAEAFAPNAWPLIGALNYRYISTEGYFIRPRIAGSLWITSDSERQDTEFFLLYSLQAGLENETVGLMIGFSGRWILTAEDAGFGEETFHQIAFAGNIALGVTRPGILIKVPLDEDFRDFMDFIIGLNVAINLK